MKKYLVIIFSMTCAVNLLACAEKTETMTADKVVTQADSFVELAAKSRKTEEETGKKKIYKAEDGNSKSQADVQIEGIVPEVYRELFSGGSFDTNLVWTTDNEAYTELTETLREYCEKSTVGSIMLATDEEIIFAGGFNAKEVDEATAVNPFTTYEIGSITQQFMGAAIMQQIQKGNLQTSDTIDQFFPEYPYGDQITVGHLLHMSSGIPDYINDSNKFFKGRTGEQYDAFMNGRMSDEEMLTFLNKAPLNFEPGKNAGYSNTDYYLLALILEQVTGESYETYMQKNLLDVCHLEATTCLETGNLTSVPLRNGTYMAIGKACRGAGDMHSNLCDILLWNKALLSGKVVDEAWLTELLDVSGGFSGGFMHMGEDTLGSVSTTQGYAAVNIIYEVNGEKFYMIYMSPEARNIMTFGKLDDMMREYLGE